MDIDALKQKILDLAIRGKLVPQDPNDEPASVLIEKIREEKNKLVKEGIIKPSKEESYIYKGSDNCYYEKIPENWVYIKLGEIITLKSGIDLPLIIINEDKEGTPYLTGASSFNKDEIKIVRWTDSPTNISKKGDILITVKGTIGQIAFNNYGDVHIARQIMAIRVNEPIVPDYIYYFLKAKINELLEKSGGLIPGITRETILSLDLLLPPFEEQKRIVHVLKECLSKTALIEKEYNEISILTMSFKKRLLDTVFGDGSSYKSYYKNRTKTTLQQLIPKDKIGDGDWVLSENMDQNGEYSLVQLKHIGYGNFYNKSFAHINDSFFMSNNCTEIKENYILINRLIADNMNACLLPHFNSKCITAVDVCWIAPSENYDQKYLLYYLLSPQFQKQVFMKTSGTTRKRISKNNLIKLELNIHEFKYQKKIADDIDKMFNILDNIIS